MSTLFKPLTTALLIETNNLRAGDDPALVEATLGRLLDHLRAQTRPLRTLDEVLVTHDGLDVATQDRLTRLAACPVRWVRLDAGTGYYEAKNQGFDASTAEVVVFADSDCWPDPGWLDALVAPFFDRQTQVVAGRTTYRDDTLGRAASAIDFLYFPTPHGEEHTRNFYANNVAFRRAVFGRFRYEAAPDVYRGHCQDLGFRLHRAGVPVRFAEAARTIHRFPDELVRLRLLRGADTVAMAPRVLRSVLPPALRPLAQVPVVVPLAVLAGRLVASLAEVRRRGVDRAACAAAVVAISAVDLLGTLARAAHLTDFGVHEGGLRRDRLGYHGDVDRLRERTAA
jgi:hypothetical protein